MGRRLLEAWELGRLAYEVLIAPWPLFPALLVVIGLVGGITPLVLLKATRELVDALMRRHGAEQER